MLHELELFKTLENDSLYCETLEKYIHVRALCLRMPTSRTVLTSNQLFSETSVDKIKFLGLMCQNNMALNGKYLSCFNINSKINLVVN